MSTADTMLRYTRGLTSNAVLIAVKDNCLSQTITDNQQENRKQKKTE